ISQASQLGRQFVIRHYEELPGQLGSFIWLLAGIQILSRYVVAMVIGSGKEAQNCPARGGTPERVLRHGGNLGWSWGRLSGGSGNPLLSPGNLKPQQAPQQQTQSEKALFPPV